MDLKTVAESKKFIRPYNNFNNKLYPAAIRAKRRVSKMERQLEFEMLEGLEFDQKKVIGKILDKNQRVRDLHENVQRGNLQSQISKTDEIVEESEFVIHKHFQKQSFAVPTLPINVPVPMSEMSPRVKYSRFIRENSQTKNKTDLREEREQSNGYEDMKNVTVQLHKWAQEALSAAPEPQPVDLLYPIDHLKKAQTPGDFDVLLHGFQPTTLESKLPIKLTVMQEESPPLSLIHSLKSNMNFTNKGTRFEKANNFKLDISGIKGKILERIEHEDFHKPMASHNKYGKWYIPAKDWNKYIQQNQSKEKRRSSFGGIVQAKLDEIHQTRLKEDAIFQQSLLQSGLLAKITPEKTTQEDGI